MGWSSVSKCARLAIHAPWVRTPIARAALAVATLAVWSGCLIAAEPCSDDGDCDRGVCARTGECTTSPIAVRLRWTVAESPPTADNCRTVESLAVAFDDRQLQDSLRYFPVPCYLGQIFFDRIPGRFDIVTVEVVDNDAVRRRMRFPVTSSEFEITFDLQP